jgi:hypothetical protein
MILKVLSIVRLGEPIFLVMYWAYILENTEALFYIGHSDNLAVRLAKGK